MIQGGALVNKDIPPYVKAAREPISYAGVNSIGLRRRGFTNEQIRDIQDIYRYLYLSGYNKAMLWSISRRNFLPRKSVTKSSCLCAIRSEALSKATYSNKP